MCRVEGEAIECWITEGEKHLKFLSIYTHNFSKSLYTNPLASAELLMGYRAKKEVEPSWLALSFSETWTKFPKNESNENYHARHRRFNLYSAPQAQN